MAVAVSSFPQSASATSISFDAFDLEDEAAGVDLWEYRYQIAGFSHGPGFGFSILFEPIQFRNLRILGEAVPGWDTIVLQPDSLLPASGIYDGLALAGGSSLNGAVFSVAFEWLGTIDPASQSFEIYNPAFETIEQGTTVPEPSTATLLAIGLIALRLSSCNRISQYA